MHSYILSLLPLLLPAFRRREQLSPAAPNRAASPEDIGTELRARRLVEALHSHTVLPGCQLRSRRVMVELGLAGTSGGGSLGARDRAGAGSVRRHSVSHRSWPSPRADGAGRRCNMSGTGSCSITGAAERRSSAQRFIP